MVEIEKFDNAMAELEALRAELEELRSLSYGMIEENKFLTEELKDISRLVESLAGGTDACCKLL